MEALAVLTQTMLIAMLSVWLQPTPHRLEPIYAPDRVFRPEDVRQRLGIIERQQSIVRDLWKLGRDPDVLRTALDLAERIRQIDANSMPPAPAQPRDRVMREYAEKLARDPTIREKARRLLDDPSIRKLVEKAAGQGAVDDFADKTRPAPVDTPPDQGTPRAAQFNASDPPDAAPTKNGASSDANLAGRIQRTARDETEFGARQEKQTATSERILDAISQGVRWLQRRSEPAARSPTLDAFLNGLQSERLPADRANLPIAQSIQRTLEGWMREPSGRRQPAIAEPPVGRAVQQWVANVPKGRRATPPAASALSGPRVKMPSLSLPRIHGPTRIISAPINFAAPDAGQFVRVFSLALVVVGIGVFAVWICRLPIERAAVLRRCRRELIDPSLPLRERIRAAYELLALSLLGENARPNHHHKIAARLGAASPIANGAAQTLADLYEQARYTPETVALERSAVEVADRQCRALTEAWLSITARLHSATRTRSEESLYADDSAIDAHTRQ